MNIKIESDNAATEYLEKFQAKINGWIIYSTGSVAIDYSREQKKWVYATGYFNKQTGGTENSIWARHPNRSKNEMAWLVGPNSQHAHEGIGNLVAIWIPSAEGYRAPNKKSKNGVQIGPLNIQPRDFVHDSWTSYSTGNKVRNMMAKTLQEQIDGLK